MSVLPPDLAAALRDRYVLEEELGRGGMATVFRARDRRHDREVALKVLDPGIGEDPGARRFELEVRTTARLSHPHILPLFEAGRAAGRLFYAMPLVEGRTLAEYLEREGPLAPEEAVRIAVVVARALAYAHAEGVVHRDVKPSNVLLHRGEPVVSDFGISRVLDEATRMTAVGVSLGTPWYMSPEQFDEGREPDGRSDQYALACVLVEMLRGEPPFPGRSARAVLGAHLLQEPPSLADHDPALAPFDDPVRRALAKDPDDRFPGMEAFASALEAAVAARSGAGTAAESGPPGLVVLPFTHLSPDADDEYLADGFTEEVIADLSRIRGLRVISRTSAMRLKRDDRPLADIAADLGVRYVMEGSVRKGGDALRITARLIDADDDAPLWADRYSGTMGELLEFQERVARAIVDALSVRLSPAEDEALSERPIADPRAYESYLRARYEAWRFSPESLERATRYIHTALGIVGDNVQLWATLGHIRAMYAESGADPDPRALERLETIADKVTTLAPDSARGHWLRAFLAVQRGEMASALRYLDDALRADPDDPDTLILAGYVHANVGRMEPARAFVERAARLDPLTPVTRLLPGFVAVLDGRPEEGLEPYREAWRMDPESPFTGMFYGWALGHVGRNAEAIEVLAQARERGGDGPFGSWAAALARGLDGDADGAAAAITPALEAAGSTASMFARALADCWALAGHPTRALDWLEQAVDLGLLNATYVAEYDPFLAGLRGDLRFSALVERMERAATALG